jgi:hypothetical protein
VYCVDAEYWRISENRASGQNMIASENVTLLLSYIQFSPKVGVGIENRVHKPPRRERTTVTYGPLEIRGLTPEGVVVFPPWPAVSAFSGYCAASRVVARS